MACLVLQTLAQALEQGLVFLVCRKRLKRLHIMRPAQGVEPRGESLGSC